MRRGAMKNQNLFPALVLAYAAAKLLLALFFPPAVAGIAFFAAWRLMPVFPMAATVIVLMGVAVLFRYATMFLQKRGPA